MNPSERHSTPILLHDFISRKAIAFGTWLGFTKCLLDELTKQRAAQYIKSAVEPYGVLGCKETPEIT